MTLSAGHYRFDEKKFVVFLKILFIFKINYYNKVIIINRIYLHFLKYVPWYHVQLLSQCIKQWVNKFNDTQNSITLIGYDELQWTSVSIKLSSILIHHYHHHHYISVMELGHLLIRSGLTYPEVSSKVSHDSFCQLGNSVSLPWVIYYGAFIYMLYPVSLVYQ